MYVYVDIRIFLYYNKEVIYINVVRLGFSFILFICDFWVSYKFIKKVK